MKNRVRKRFGQHFLTDEGVLERIAAAVGIEASDAVVEIGPGQGALTQYLLPLVKHLDVIEIDRDLVAWLKQQYKEEPRLTIHQADVLQFDWQTLFTRICRVVLVCRSRGSPFADSIRTRVKMVI